MSGYTSTRPYLIRALHEWMGDNALTAHIVVDATVPGVQVPPGSVRDGQVILNISMQATHRLELGNEGLRFAARFGGREQWVEVPVEAVVAIFARENGQGMSFDAPSAAPGAAQADPAADRPGPTPLSANDVADGRSDPVPSARPRGVGAGADAGASAQPPEDQPPDDSPPPPRGRPSLKVVK